MHVKKLKFDFFDLTFSIFYFYDRLRFAHTVFIFFTLLSIYDSFLYGMKFEISMTFLREPDFCAQKLIFFNLEDSAHSRQSNLKESLKTAH